VNTGVTNATLPMTMTGLAAILIGFGLVLIARRRSGEHG
jgi:LPXTG-motif cell wall-anchored protein